MKQADVYAEAFRNQYLLRAYMRGDFAANAYDNDSVDKITMQGLYQGLRRQYPKQPDHAIHPLVKSAFSEPQNTNRYLLTALKGLQRHYLNSAGYQRYVVKTETFGSWQAILSILSPLPILMHALSDDLKYAQNPIKDEWWTKREDTECLLAAINRQCRYTALPSIHSPFLDMLAKQYGFDDLHIHLNGSTDWELVWRGALSAPIDFYENIKNTDNKNHIADQLAQEEEGLSFSILQERLYIARWLRQTLENTIFGQIGQQECSDWQTILKNPFDEDKTPFETEQLYTPWGPKVIPPLQHEALFWFALIQKMQTSKNPDFFHCANLYLLIQGQFQRLLVQQRDHWGFDQFQKIADNNMRRRAEKTYAHRYQQLNFSEYGDLDRLEGRFAPGVSRKNSETLLKEILGGYLQWKDPHQEDDQKISRNLSEILEELDKIEEKPSVRRMTLRLVGHFIKKPDNKFPGQPDDAGYLPFCRHRDLRLELNKAMRRQLGLMEKYPRLRKYIVGYDAAANELHAGPDVFAPVFRHLKRQGFRHFTYHAGEDFNHLLSGIRTIWETIEFLDFGVGCRIGHATAIGIDPCIWRKRAGTTFILKRGQRLDDLVILHKLLAGHAEFAHFIQSLEQSIDELATDIFQQPVSISSLYKALSNRWRDPLVSNDDAISYTEEEVQDIQSFYEEGQNTTGLHITPSDLLRVWQGLHGKAEYVQRYEQEITIDSNHDTVEQALSPEILRFAQACILEKVRSRGIALEVLPTSNVTISWYEDICEHHIYTWLGIIKNAYDPAIDMTADICVGTDDPGIFATNIRNEYAHILNGLLQHGKSTTEARDILTKLVQQGKIFRFEGSPTTDVA